MFGLLVPMNRRLVIASFALAVIFLVAAVSLLYASVSGSGIAATLLLLANRPANNPGSVQLIAAAYILLIGACVAAVRMMIKRQNAGGG